ncbi:MAG: alpha/beta hydrolase [Beijerinckiaceae bacterium]|jgi:pimeloyl-ACP methyl ester carboxylesterase|nr:alpha/beta hydrolase [Beijerinckiaceae bacterium]
MNGAIENSMVSRGDIRLEVYAQGAGPTMVLLPSLGRGAEDFEPMAERLAEKGFRTLRPQPRGIGRSSAAPVYADLQDCAADIAAVIEADGKGPAIMVGHAFGNRVSRMLATARPDLVSGVVLVAANVGHAPSPPKVREAIRNSANPALPDDVRLDALRFAFFAPGNDAEPWLRNWHPEVLAAQRVAGDQTARSIDYAAGRAPVLYMQPSHDPLAHAEDAVEYKAALGDRLTVVKIPSSSHAAIAEQPMFIADEIAAWARRILA